jgi:hypothetical protein
MKAVINRERLVKQSLMGRIHHPGAGSAYRLDARGASRVYPATGGITYNVAIGDSVYAMACDHVEPGVSISNADKEENTALNLLSCIGNEARVITGDAKGAKGFVTGTHGGIEHVLAWFAPADLENMAPEDKILIRGWGQGMEIAGFEDNVFAMNLDPDLFDRLGITVQSGKLQVAVAARVPAHLMGSGMGAASAYTGDYDIMTADRAEIARRGLDKLRYGDIVLLEDSDTSYGRGFLAGAVTIGVIVHSDCIKMGHGPGVTTILTAKTPIIEGFPDSQANLRHYLRL